MGILQDRVAIVSGAGRGIGRAVALELARQGAKVLVDDPGVALDGSDPDAGPAGQVVAEIQAGGGTAAVCTEPVGSMASAERIIEAAQAAFGERIDILVCVAGILRDRMVFNMTEEEWDAVLTTHLKGTFTLVRTVARLMRGQRYGRIVTFTSGSGILGNTGQANYSAAKGGILSLTRTAALDLARYGVTVNCVAPEANTRMIGAIPAAAMQLRAEQGTLAGGTAPTAMPEPEDVAPLVAYLASEQAGWLTGEVFLASGGTVGHYPIPEPRQIWKSGRWTAEELAEVLPARLFEPGYRSRGLPSDSAPS